MAAELDARGWAMRRGHCKRLRGEKGRESTRGRAAFARSVNKSRRFEFFDRDVEMEQRRKARHLHEDLRDELDLYATSGVAWQEAAVRRREPCTAFQGCGDTEESGEAGAASCLETAASTKGSDETGSTAAPSEGSSSPRISAVVGGCIEEGTGCTTAPRSRRWVLALARAERAAAAYFAAHRRPAALSRAKQCKERPQNKAPFEQLRKQFFKDYKDVFVPELAGTFGMSVSVNPTPMSLRAVDDFMKVVAAVPLARLELVYHGTRVEHYRSIFERGLIVPGKMGVTVRNGSAHGVGIYTAPPGFSSTSRYYAGESRVLVCGLVDPQWPDAVKRFPGAVVLFQENLVIPLYEAVGYGMPLPPWQPPMPPPPLLANAGQHSRRQARAERHRAKLVRKPGTTSATVAFLVRRAAERRRS